MEMLVMLISMIRGAMISRHCVTLRGVDSEDVIMQDKRQDDTDISKLKRKEYEKRRSHRRRLLLRMTLHYLPSVRCSVIGTFPQKT